MKKGDALPGKYLAQSDFPQPTLAIIKEVVMESVNNDSGGKEEKPVLYVMGASNPVLDCKRGIILNVGNWDACEQISGAADSDDWPGVEIVILVDSEVMFGGKKVGGIRIRAPKKSALPTRVEEPPPHSASDDVPF